MMSRLFVTVFVSAVLCGATAVNARAEVKVVATVPGLAALARDVGGAHVSVKSLTRGSQDPHFVDARPSLALDLNRADLLLVVGSELEVGWLPTLLTGARNPKIQPGSAGHLDCSRFVKLLEVAHHPVDRSQGDIHPGGNPHYLVDPRAAVSVAQGIARRLAEIDPGHAKAFEDGAARLIAELGAAQKKWEARLAPHRGASIIGYHRTWAYLSDWLGFVEVGFVEPKPGIPPTPAHVSGLLQLARQKKARIILQEQYYPDRTSRIVAEKIPAPLVRVPGGPTFETGQSYTDYVSRIVTLLAGALAPGGKGN